MGVNKLSDEMIISGARNAQFFDGDSVPKVNLLLIGRQLMRKKVRKDFRLAQRHYASMTMLFKSVFCIDLINGKPTDGEYFLRLDLGEEQKNLWRQYELIFNGGTAEYVENQREFWRNAHYFLATGGIAIHVCPIGKEWKNHSPYLYSPEFFDLLISKNKYDLMKQKIVEHKKSSAIYVMFRKLNDNPFQWKGLDEYIIGYEDEPEKMTVDEEEPQDERGEDDEVQMPEVPEVAQDDDILDGDGDSVEDVHEMQNKSEPV